MKEARRQLIDRLDRLYRSARSAGTVTDKTGKERLEELRAAAADFMRDLEGAPRCDEQACESADGSSAGRPGIPTLGRSAWSEGREREMAAVYFLAFNHALDSLSGEPDRRDVQEIVSHLLQACLAAAEHLQVEERYLLSSDIESAGFDSPGGKAQP